MVCMNKIVPNIHILYIQKCIKAFDVFSLILSQLVLVCFSIMCDPSILSICLQVSHFLKSFPCVIGIQHTDRVCDLKLVVLALIYCDTVCHTH